MKAIILPIDNSTQRSAFGRRFCSVLLLLFCFVLVLKVHAVSSPPDGGYPGANTAEGTDALFSVTSGESNTIRIGKATRTKTYIAGISQVAVAGDPVIVNLNGQLGVSSSSKRFKDEIKPLGDASEAILALKPVAFHYKNDLDPKRVTRFGLVAEEMEKINPDLVARDAKGEVYTVCYEAVSAMLLNDFLKEHSKVEQLETTAAEQATEIKTLKTALEEQAAQIQKVSAQLEMAKPAAKVARTDE